MLDASPSRELVDSLRLRRQWTVGSTATDATQAWPTVVLKSGHTLRYHTDSRYVDVASGDEGVVVLGVAIATDYPLDLNQWLRAFLAASEVVKIDLLRRLAGTYVVIHHAPSRLRFFTDPAAMMQVFYRRGRAASTPALLEPLENDTELERQYPFGLHNDWYVGSLTPFRGVQALMANHVLDLLDGTCRRFWPTVQLSPLLPAMGKRRLAQLTSEVTRAALAAGPVLSSLTGGKDSRLNLAALRGSEHLADFFTIRGHGVKECDVHIPAKLASEFGLRHRFVENFSAPPWLLELYDEMTCGLSIGGRRDVVGAVLPFIEDDYIHLNGSLGALGKAYLWPSKKPKHVSRRSLAKELASRPPRVRESLDEWLDSVPPLPAPTIYNLMYLEQRVGRWTGIGETASNLFFHSFTPFSSREIFETISRLPPETQAGGGLLIETVRELWPELLQVPYCPSRRKWSAHVPRKWKNRYKYSSAGKTLRNRSPGS